MTRGRPFEPGNKFGRGRPPGSRNRRTLAAQTLLDQYADPIVRRALQLALEGDRQLLQAFLDRILPRQKDPTVRIGPLRARTPEDLVRAHEKVLQKVASGLLSPGQAQPISNMLEDSRKIMESGEFDRRLRLLEQPPNKDQDDAA